MRVAISAEQRDALYEQLLILLTGVGDELHTALGTDYEAADRLGRDYSDALRLILDDLGWGEKRGGEVALTTPPEALRRVLDRVRKDAIVGCEVAREEQAEAANHQRQHEFVRETCDDVLARLESR